MSYRCARAGWQEETLRLCSAGKTLPSASILAKSMTASLAVPTLLVVGDIEPAINGAKLSREVRVLVVR